MVPNMKVINFSVPSGLQINIIPNNAKINDSIIETHLLFLKSFSMIFFVQKILRKIKGNWTFVIVTDRTDLDDLRLQAYYDLLVQDIESMRTAAEAKSKKCSESAKCRTSRNASSPTIPAKKANAANTTTSKPKAITETIVSSPAADTTNVIEVPKDSEHLNDSSYSKDSNGTVASSDFNASDVTSSFDRLKVIYKKIGDNESQALGVWQQLSESERTAAFAHTQRLQGDLSSRSYLYVYLRDKEWTKATSPVTQQGDIS